MHSFRSLTLVLACVGLTACEDDSTGPSTIDLRLAAWTFDALSRSRTEAGDGNGAVAARHAARALRAGIRPTRVSISVDGVAEEYLALETEHAFGNVADLDIISPGAVVLRTMVAWRGGTPDRFLAISVLGDTGTFRPFFTLLVGSESPPVFETIATGAVLFERGGPPFFGIAGGARTTRQSLGIECGTPPTSSFRPPFGAISCRRAAFLTRFTMTASEIGRFTTGAPSRVVQMGSQEVAGVRFEYPALPTQCPLCR
jgi:hypothetical protein